MLRLIKNELFKIFKKKSTIIILFFMFAFVVLTNCIYRFLDDDYDMYYNGYESMTEANNYISSNSPEANISDYAYYKALIDTYEEASKYDKSSWQYKLLFESFFPASNDYYYALYSNTDTTSYLDKRNLILDRINNGNWQVFVEEEIDSNKSELDNIKLSLNNANLTKEEKKYAEQQAFILEEQTSLLEYRLKENLSYDSDYLNTALNEALDSIYSVAEAKYSSKISISDTYQIKNYYINKYILEEKVDANNSNTLRFMYLNFFNEFTFLIILLIVIISGSIVSEEVNKGTIKKLLILPYKRSKILLSKYLTTIIMLLFGILFLSLSEFLVGGILFGFDSLSIPFITYNMASSSIVVMNMFSYYLLSIIVNLPKLILLSTLAWALSTIFSNTSFATALTFAGYAASSIINLLAETYQIKILNYFVTTCWNFESFLFGGTSEFGLSLTHSIVVCLVYFLVMIVVSFIVFNKKDIKNI